MRLRSGSPWKCGGLKKDAAQNGPRVLSAAITPRGNGQGRPRPDALKSWADGRRVRGLTQERVWRGGTDRAAVSLSDLPAQTPQGSSLPARCAYTLLEPPCVGLFSPHLSITQPPPHPYSFLRLPLAPPRIPDPFIYTPRPTSSPRSSCNRSGLGLLWLPRTRWSLVPAGLRTDRRGGAVGQPTALRSRAPSRMGGAWL